MEKGLAIIEKTDTETKGFYIDQDALEFARQNAKVNKRLAEQEQNRRVAELKVRKAQKEEAKRKAYMVETIKYEAFCFMVILACTAALVGGFISPVISFPISLYCLCAACVRLGKQFGRGERK